MGRERSKSRRTPVTVLALVLMLGIVGTASANVRVDELSGLVQFRAPNAQTWSRVNLDSVLPEGSTVVSGVNGSAVLTAGNSTITVTPLSRVIVERVTVQPTREDTTLRMPYGRVTAQVRRSRERGMDFRVVTPVSTAAVRGTAFTYDGTNLIVQEGDVSFSNLIGQRHSVRRGQTSRTWQYADIQSVEATMEDNLTF